MGENKQEQFYESDIEHVGIEENIGSVALYIMKWKKCCVLVCIFGFFFVIMEVHYISGRSKTKLQTGINILPFNPYKPIYKSYFLLCILKVHV